MERHDPRHFYYNEELLTVSALLTSSYFLVLCSFGELDFVYGYHTLCFESVSLL